MRMRSFQLLCFIVLVLFTLSACDSAGFAPSPSAPETGVPSKDADPSEPNPDAKPVPQPEAGQLTAGEWRDLDHWNFWLELMNSQDWSAKQAYWGFYPVEKIWLQVDDVVDASVTLLDSAERVLWESRTNNAGEAILFPSLFEVHEGPYSLIVKQGQESLRIEDAQVNTAEPIKLSFPASNLDDSLDLMFVIDTTGSMSDELEYLKVELQDVVTRVRQTEPNLDLRLSANYYRDEGDSYVVRSFPFTKDVSEVVSQIAKQRASGGGDYPEALSVALDDALNNHDWRETAKARLLFLVLDAPPHYEQSVLSKLQQLTRQAAKQGIRVIPLASSGVDKDTEFLMRFLSIATAGTYTFLTNDSGIGNEKIEPTIGDYQLEFLNDLLVRIISRSID